MAFLGEGNDPFDDIVREFFGKDVGAGSPKKREVIRGESDEGKIDYVEDENNVYLLLEVPGYSDKDVTINISGDNLTVNAAKKEEDIESMPEYMSKKLIKGTSINKTLPENVKAKNFEKTVKNGVLEIKFNKK